MLRRPLAPALVAAALLVALAVPALRMHTATPSASDLPHDLPVLQVRERIQQAIPGGVAPAIVVITTPDVNAAPVREGIASLQRKALATGQLHQPVSIETDATGTVATVSIALAGDGEDKASYAALRTLREEVIPGTVGHIPGVNTAVGGLTAATADFNNVMKQRAPLVIRFVLVLAFGLLLFSFRSLVVSLNAILLNLLSVAASYSVLVLVFQHTWAESILGFRSTGSIASWVPLFLFVVLFGLSMDYHVFILSRVRKACGMGLRTRDAVTHSITATAGVVTAAATVMVFVFLTFATLSQVSLKQAGVGLAVAVLIDATVVRGVLLPATMVLLGSRNWYLPRWLAWLPERGPTAGPLHQAPVAGSTSIPALIGPAGVHISSPPLPRGAPGMDFDTALVARQEPG
ncbi:MAG: MMPL family transporter [Frankiaceae bacterium]